MAAKKKNTAASAKKTSSGSIGSTTGASSLKKKPTVKGQIAKAKKDFSRSGIKSKGTQAKKGIGGVSRSISLWVN